LSSFKIHIIQFYAFNQVLTSIHRPFTSVNTQKKTYSNTHDRERSCVFFFLFLLSD